MKQTKIQVRGLMIGEGRPKICIPIVGKTEEEVCEQARLLLQYPADLVEWRADWFENLRDLHGLLHTLEQLRDILGEKPLLFTIRTSQEGGEVQIRAGEYRALNMEAARSGLVDLVDVEMFRQSVSHWEQRSAAGMELQRSDTIDLIRDLKATGVKVVGSSHDFAATPQPAAMVGYLRAMQDMGADICKLAVMPHNEGDVLNLLYATWQMKNKYAERPVITMAMGGMGAVSRMCGELCGSAVTFGTAGKLSAPGQIGAEQLFGILQLLHGGMGADEEETPAEARHVFLIGFMGTGKSTVAAKLTKLMDRKQIEMDARLEEEEGQPIASLFEEYGEEYFRDKETKLLQRIAREIPSVVSCGGGVVVREENVACMKKHGRIVLLTAAPETVLARVSCSRNRPILNGNMNVEYISQLMERRRALYEAAADLVVATDGRTVDQICQEIMENLH